jgi:four helix bundle protein
VKKKKTPNADRRVAMVQWTRPNSVHEDAPRYGPLSKIDSTSNAQHSTPNAQLISKIRFDLEERLLDFSVRIIRLVDALPNTRAANHIAGQLLRCGTSTYGNHGEVEAAESRKDFVHKLKVCLKELKETRHWLRLIGKSSMLPETKMTSMLNETEELIKIFFSSVRTAEKNPK